MNLPLPPPWNSVLVEQIKKYIEVNITSIGPVNEIAGIFGIPMRNLQDIFRHYSGGYTFTGYIKHIRLIKLKEMLLNGGALNSTFELSEQIGFSSTSVFFNFVSTNTGKTFMEYKKEVLKEAGIIQRQL